MSQCKKGLFQESSRSKAAGGAKSLQHGPGMGGECWREGGETLGWKLGCKAVQAGGLSMERTVSPGRLQGLEGGAVEAAQHWEQPDPFPTWTKMVPMGS